MYSILADLVVSLHVAFVLIVILGQLLIPIGVWRNWRWVLNHWFRWTHLSMIAIVASEAWLGITCPLTTLEAYLRDLAGQAHHQQSFIAYWFDKILFYSAPEWVFTLLYSGFFAMVILSFLIWPPQKNRLK